MPEVTYGTTYEIDKFHSKIVYVGLAQACPNYFVFRIAISKPGLVAGESIDIHVKENPT